MGWIQTGSCQLWRRHALDARHLRAPPRIGPRSAAARQIIETLEQRVLCAVASARYSVVDLGSRRAESVASDVNDAAQVVGYATGVADGNDDTARPVFFEEEHTVDLPTFGGEYSEAFAVNDSGQVVGVSEISATSSRPFMFASDALIDLGTLGGSFGAARDINNGGLVVGQANGPGDAFTHAFAYRDGVMTDIGLMVESDWSEAHAVNDAGQIVGFYETGEDGPEGLVLIKRAFVFDGQTFQALPLGGAAVSDAAAADINEVGQIVGYFRTSAGDLHAFQYEQGVTQDLGTLPGGRRSSANAINGRGLAVGDAEAAGGEQHAVVYEGGAPLDLNTLIPADSGWVLQSATGINDAGQIVGYGVVQGSADLRAFLLTLAGADTAPPTAEMSQAQPTPAVGATGIDFAVTYRDDGGIALETLGDGDVTVTLSGQSDVLPAVLVSQDGNGQLMTAVYRLVPPGGSLDDADNGEYTVRLMGGQVADAAGNAAASVDVGTFVVSVAPAPTQPAPDITVAIESARLGPSAYRGHSAHGFTGGDRGSFVLRVSNVGAASLNRSMSIGLSLSIDRLPDPTDVQVQNLSAVARLRAGATRRVPVKFVYPHQVPEANYYFLLTADPAGTIAEANEANNVASTDAQAAVRPALVDFGLRVGSPAPDGGGRFRVESTSRFVPVTVENLGTAAYSGPITLLLRSTRTDPAGGPGAGNVIVANTVKRIALKPGARRVVRVRMPLAVGLPKGSFLIAEADPENIINEKVETNNSDVITIPF